MKQRGKIIQVNGEWTQYPTSRAEAMRENIVKYREIPTPVCPECGERSVRYTKTGICGSCAIIQSCKAYNEAIYNGEPTDPHDARLRDYGHYWQLYPGKNCGHPGMTLLNGRCALCKSPRQQAAENGETWYMPFPEYRCPKGHNSPKRVLNGSCKQCEEERTGPRPIWQTDPDIIIDRETAKALGFNVYRTGEPCKHGHTGWRYISNNGCLECARAG